MLFYYYWFNKRNYEVPIVVFFSKFIPLEPPKVFLEVSKGSAINTKTKDVDLNTRKINRYNSLLRLGGGILDNQGKIILQHNIIYYVVLFIALFSYFINSRIEHISTYNSFNNERQFLTNFTSFSKILKRLSSISLLILPVKNFAVSLLFSEFLLLTRFANSSKVKTPS